VVADAATRENIYTEICTQIIKEQEQIIGALAVEQAQQVVGLTVDPVSYHCTVVGDGSKVIDDLIEQYRDFFGHAAVEVCKEAASKFVNKLPAEALPTSLR
jgi:polyhydroxyalkanoate synthesis regulator protein